MANEMIETCGMDTLTAMRTRRSIRKFTEESVSQEMLNTVLEAGFCAPSAHNLRPWEFVVVRDAAARQGIAEHGKYTKMAATADTVIAVCGDTVKSHFMELLINDCSAAVENMLLAAHGLRLGAVWCGVVQGQDLCDYLKELLKLPAHILPFALVVIGHPGEVRPVAPRFDPACVHCEVFSKE